MKPYQVNPTDQTVLHALCSDPWSNDRELALSHHLKQSTLTACKNRLKTKGLCKKVYFPAYNRLGLPLVSFSQLCLDRPPEGLLKALSEYQGLLIDENTRSLVSYLASDPFNTFVMAHHKDYTSFKMFERVLGTERKWSHEVCTMEGAIKVVNFDYTNIINRLFFPTQFEPSKPKLVNIIPIKFHRTEKTIFDGLLAHQGTVLSKVAGKIKVTRQSVVKSLNKFRKEGILEKNTVVDLGQLGIQIGAIITFKMNNATSIELSKLNRAHCPFYYWVFENVHVLMVANTDYKDTMTSLGQLNKAKGISDLRIQLVQV
jgi:hypothetical protein